SWFFIESRQISEPPSVVSTRLGLGLPMQKETNADSPNAWRRSRNAHFASRETKNARPRSWPKPKNEKPRSSPRPKNANTKKHSRKKKNSRRKNAIPTTLAVSIRMLSTMTAKAGAATVRSTPAPSKCSASTATGSTRTATASDVIPDGDELQGRARGSHPRLLTRHKCRCGSSSCARPRWYAGGRCVFRRRPCLGVHPHYWRPCRGDEEAIKLWRRPDESLNRCPRKGSQGCRPRSGHRARRRTRTSPRLRTQRQLSRGPANGSASGRRGGPDVDTDPARSFGRRARSDRCDGRRRGTSNC